jgi:tetratricopeptide (TPR) repeat protein
VESSAREDEETVVPVRPGLAPLRRAAAPPAPVAVKSTGPFWYYVGGGVLLLAALFVFAILPRLVERSRAPEPAPAASVAETPAEPERAPLTPQELAALQAQADALLAGLLTQRKDLETLHAESWAAEEWSRYSALSDEGDDAYLANDFAKAVDKLTEADDLGKQLLARSDEIVARAIEGGQQAFDAGNSAAAIAQYDIVLGIEPDNDAAKAGRARAERLPEVLALIARADAERDSGELQQAIATYKEALAIDPQWTPAGEAIATLNKELRDAEFERLMSKGYGALSAENYAEAQQHFKGALGLRPQAKEAQDGLTQAEEGARLDQIALLEARALAFERRELWDQAIAQYKEALAGDPNLVFAQTGLDRAEIRAGLDAKLRNLIDNPTLLFGDTVLSDARKLVEEARAVPQRGPRLEEQIGKLERLVTLASTPVAVELQSDQLTEVTVYRVGPLGVFASKQLELRPGTYTAIGSRNGYRDVRQTFTVLPGRTLEPIKVICTEQIGSSRG